MVRYTLLLTALVASACAASEPRASDPVPSADVSGTLFVANKRGNSLSMIDLASGEEVKRVDSCTNPHELAISPDGNHVALACYAGRNIDIFATSDLERVVQVELGEGARPHGIAWHANGAIVASAEGRGSIFVIENPLQADAGVREIGSGAPGPHMVVVNDQFTHAWGTVIPTGTVIRYDLAKGEETHRELLGGQLEAIALSSDGTDLWIGANATSKAYRLSAADLSVASETETGPVPIRLAMHPSGKWVVSSNFGEGGLSVIDTDTGELARSIPVSGGKQAVQVTLVFSADGRRLYAAETATNTVAEIDFEKGEVIRRFEAGEGGDGLAVLTKPDH